MTVDNRWRRVGVLRLPHDETDERRRYTFPHPDELIADYIAVRARLYPWLDLESMPKTVTVGRLELAHVLRLAEGYLHLTTYELGQEHCVAQLRDVWRARRAGR